MPIYMDRHDLDAVTARDVAEAHREDLKIQHRYQCKGLTYWFDEERGTAFCLVEAPNEDCVRKMHDAAHGLVAHQIIEVDPGVVNAFLGRIEDPKSDVYLEDTSQPIIDESAFRIIMYVYLKDIVVLRSVVDEKSAREVISSSRSVIRNCISRYNGRTVKKDRKRLILSFTSAASAVMCALEIQNNLKHIVSLHAKSSFKVKISLTAGPPVAQQNELFGDAIALAARLSEMVDKQEVVLSSAVKEAYNNEIIDGLSRELPLQSLSPDDERFIVRLMDTTDTVWKDPKFNIEVFGRKIGLSRSQLYRKTISLTGFSPNDFVKEFRLNKALNLIERQEGNVAQIAYDTGFSSPSYFSKCFLKRYGTLPSSLAGKLA